MIFSPNVSNLNIPRYQDLFTDSDQTENRIEHPILRITEQHKNHPSIIAINTFTANDELTRHAIPHFKLP